MVIGETAVNASLQAIELADPFLQNFQPLFVKITLLFGGLFGLYLFILAMNLYYNRKKVKVLKDIRYDLDQQNIHNGLKYSHHRKKGVVKWWKKIAHLVKGGSK
ncbi:MAG: hypothetical protein WCV90_07295 [Candidatus Woesearchaeota archaeon]|jgi:hypothetical protein